MKYFEKTVNKICKYLMNTKAKYLLNTDTGDIQRHGAS